MPPGFDAVLHGVALRTGDVANVVRVAEVPPELHGRPNLMRWNPTAHRPFDVGAQQRVERRALRLGSARWPTLALVVENGHTVDVVHRSIGINASRRPKVGNRDVGNIQRRRSSVGDEHVPVSRFPARLRARNVVDLVVHAHGQLVQRCRARAADVVHLQRILQQRGLRRRSHSERRQRVAWNQRVDPASGGVEVRGPSPRPFDIRHVQAPIGLVPQAAMQPSAVRAGDVLGGEAARLVQVPGVAGRRPCALDVTDGVRISRLRRWPPPPILHRARARGRYAHGVPSGRRVVH
eukprot:scaffold965_cov262-Pinguiococcus_pyrenoidosus.AAC.19